jgi:tetratricopeptide (TPR) repeat protein
MYQYRESQILMLLVLPLSGLVSGAQTQQSNPSIEQQQVQGLGRQPSSTPVPFSVTISGAVVTRDGVPPTTPVTVQAFCNGIESSLVPVDAKGKFAVRISDRTQGLIPSADASRSRASGGLVTQEGQRINCTVAVRAQDYLTWTRNLTNLRLLDHPDLGPIVLARAGKVDGVTVSMTSLEAPPDASNAYLKGRKAAIEQEWNKARAEFEKAVAAYPKYAEAWYELGEVHERKKQFAEAVRSYRESLAADPKYLNPYPRLIVLAAQERKWREVSEWAEKLIRLDPLNFPSAYYFHMLANFNMREFAPAERSARETLRRDEQHRFPKAHHLLGLMLANMGDNASASVQLKEYLRLVPGATDAELVKKQLAEVERRLASSSPQPR